MIKSFLLAFFFLVLFRNQTQSSVFTPLNLFFRSTIAKKEEDLGSNLIRDSLQYHSKVIKKKVMKLYFYFLKK